jgi:hypothetical protein
LGGRREGREREKESVREREIVCPTAPRAIMKNPT